MSLYYKYPLELQNNVAAGSSSTPKRWERTQSEVYLKGRAPAVNIVDSAIMFNDRLSSDSDDSLTDNKVSEHTKVRDIS